MGVATGCGCKEVYRFPHTTYPYSSCICSFLQVFRAAHPQRLGVVRGVVKGVVMVCSGVGLVMGVVNNLFGVWSETFQGYS